MEFPTPSARLIHYGKQARDLRRQARTAPGFADHVDLKDWQSQRLAATHAALHKDARYRPAVDFFLGELYGPKDFAPRDEELARVIPVMVRFLPERALETLADAVEMDALSESLDADMVDALRQAGAAGRVDGVSYAAAYRDIDRDDDRALQIELVRRIGGALDHLTRLPLLRATLRMMRKPAHMAGLAHLQQFLETGFDAFAHMRGAEFFIGEILRKETDFMNHLLAGGDG